jgi:putative NADH-flavin reductase
MRLLLFGATGGTGRELLHQALATGHNVTAFARNPDRLADVNHDNLTIVRGDVTDPAAVASAIAGHEAVLSTIGAGAARTTLREVGTRNIVDAMQSAGVKRLISLSSLGVGDSRANLGFFTRYIIVGLILRHAFADHQRQEAVIHQSTLDWTIVRPPHLKDGPRTGDYRHGFAPTDHNIKGWISRADVTDFMLRQLADPAYVHQTPGLSY